jgi:RNA polymerase sigma-70 factor (ECF subfamily)
LSSEKKLLRQARKFDQHALAEIYDQYSPGLFRYAYRQLGGVELAEDCVAETFSRFLKALSTGGGPKEHLQAYLYRVAHNWITDQFRRQPPPLPFDEDFLASTEGDIQEQVETRSQENRVRAALARITPDQRQVIVLKYLEGWNNAEVAKMLDKPVGSIKSLQHRALLTLRRVLLDGEEQAK